MANQMKDLQKLPVLKPEQVMEHFGKKRAGGEEPGKVLVEAGDFIEMLEAVSGLKLSRRELLRYCSGRLGLVDAPVTVGAKACFVFPDQFDRVGIVATLRRVYHLPLAAIRDLLAHYPRENYDLIMERKIELHELLDLAQSLKNGFGLGDMMMAKASDVLLSDLLSSNKALSAALEPGDTLQQLQEKLVLGRLDEMKNWVSSGRWREFLKRESAEDFKNLAVKQLLHSKILAKVLAKRARHQARKKS